MGIGVFLVRLIGFILRQLLRLVVFILRVAVRTIIFILPRAWNLLQTVFWIMAISLAAPFVGVKKTVHRLAAAKIEDETGEKYKAHKDKYWLYRITFWLMLWAGWLMWGGVIFWSAYCVYFLLTYGVS